MESIMKKLLLPLLVLMFSLPNAWAEEFTEGVDYTTIAKPVKTSDPDKIVVTELFWYGCPHCFRFEPYAEKWKKTIADDVKFEQIPSTLNPSWVVHARTYYALQLIGKLDDVHAQIFNAIHIKNKRLSNRENIADFLAQFGVDRKKFKDAYNSFPIETKLRKNGTKERKYGVSGVPSVIVNGKYITSGSHAGSYSRMLKILDHLVALERQ